MLRRVHGLGLPCRARRPRHEAHERLVAEGVRGLAEFRPDVRERVVSPAELGEQLAIELREVVASHRTVGVLLLDRQPAIHPGERLGRLVPLREQGREREAVLGREMRLFAERDVGAHVTPPGVDRAQDSAPAGVHAVGVTAVFVLGRGRGGLRVERRPHGSLERLEGVLVHHLDGIVLEGGRERVGIVLHAIEQQVSGFVRAALGRLPRLDPAAVEIRDEHPEVAARVIQLFGLLVAAAKEGLVKEHGLPGTGTDESLELPGDLFEARDELPARSPPDEPPGLERGLDRGLQWVSAP